MTRLALVAVSFLLAGLLLAGWWGHMGIKAQYESRLTEWQARYDVERRAVDLLAKDKFQAHAARVEMARKNGR